MNTKVRAYLDAVCDRVKCRDVHDEIRQELESHLGDLIEHHREAGLLEEQAVDAALAQMGAPEITGDQLNLAHKPRTEWGLIGATALFVLLGLWAAYAVGVTETAGSGTLRRQLLWTALGLCAGIAAFFMDYRRLYRFAWPAYAVTVACIVVVRHWSLMTNSHDFLLHRSPMLLTIALAGVFAKWDWSDRRSIWKVLALLVLPVLVYLWAPSISSAVQYGAGFAVLCLASRPKRWQVGAFVGAAGAMGAAMMAWLLSAPYRAERLWIWLDPTRDPQGAGYQIVQSRRVLQGAGLWGHGPTASLDHHLPEAYSEFIFPFLVHTLGWVAGSAIVVLAALFVARLLQVAGQIRDQFGRFVVIAVLATLAVQFGWNLLMTVGWLPTIGGVSLPFVAFGSQQALQMAAVGLALSVFRRKDMGRTPYLG